MRVIAISVLAVIPAAAGAASVFAAPPEPGRVRVDRVSTETIKLRSKNRARNETAYVVRHRESGDSEWTRKRLPRNRENINSRGLQAGTLYEHQAPVTPC